MVEEVERYRADDEVQKQHVKAKNFLENFVYAMLFAISDAEVRCYRADVWDLCVCACVCLLRHPLLFLISCLIESEEGGVGGDQCFAELK